MNYTLKSGRTLHILEAEETDAADLLHYLEEVAKESDCLSSEPGEFDMPVEKEAAILKRFKEASGKVYFVALLEGEIVATLSFSNGSRKHLHHFGEFGMSVRKKHWGDGIGTILVDSLLEWARASGIITKINLMVRADNTPAIQLYLKKGFTLEGTIPRGIRIKGAYHDVDYMGLCL